MNAKESVPENKEWKKWALWGGAVLVALWLIASYATLASMEEGIRAQEPMVDLAIDKLVKKADTGAVVLKDFKGTLKQVLKDTIGEGGRAADTATFFKAVGEAYPNTPPEMWRDYSHTLNAEYEGVAAVQGTQVDRVRAFRATMRNPLYAPASVIGRFPTIDLARYEKIIIGSEARSARESGTLESVKPSLGESKSEADSK